MISETLARRVLEAALRRGADFAELFVEDTESNSMLLSDGVLQDSSYSRLRGAGVRVLRGTASAYAYTSSLDPDDLLKTAAAAAAALQEAPADTAVAPFAVRNYALPAEVPFASVEHTQRAALLKQAEAAARGAGPAISQVLCRYLDVDQRVLIASSEGVFAADRRPRTRLAVQAVATRDADSQTGTASPGFGMGFEAYRRIDPEACGKEAARQALTMLDAPQCPAASVPVVIDGGFGGVIFHEACGHSLEATSVSKGNSEFCGKLGKLIAAPCVTAVDDGTRPGDWGTLSIDDEGTPTRKNVLIENGVLKGYLIDKLGARRMGMDITGSSRRQSYKYAPTSRMTNTYIAAGQDDPEEMIRTMGEGLYAKAMGGGSVNPATGEFNFAVLEGYWVRDGRILTPVRGATLVGRGADVLTRIDRIGPEMWQGQGMCGSQSGSIPTNVGQPRIRVSEITVGGKGGAL